MKLILEQVRFKNFLSYGETWSEFDLNRSNHVTVITAKNGNGKSVITDALSFALFGKSIRKSTKAELINRKNKKGTLVECKFKVDDVSYLVRRGIKPDIFEIYSGDSDKPLNEDSSSRDYQKILENNILKMNYITFIQTVIVSKTLYTPFMTLPAPKRRLFVESILRLHVFSGMSKLHKEKISSIKIKHNEEKNKLVKFDITINEVANNINTIRELIESSTNEKRLYIQKQLDSNVEEKNNLIVNYKDLESKLISIDTSIKTEYSKLNTLQLQLIAKKDNLNATLLDINTNGTKCDKCGTEYSKDHMDKHINDIADKINKIEEVIATNIPKLETLSSMIAVIDEQNAHNIKINSELSFIKKSLLTISGNCNKLKTELDSIQVDTTKLDIEQEKLERLKNDRLQCDSIYQELTKELNYCNIVTNMLKDDGIKANIINKSIPLINKLINKNLSDFGFFVKFELDSEFNDSILVRGFEKASYSNFSEGEKLRIDLAILLTWRDIAMMKNAMSCNVLFLDEITDASMDDEGIDVFIKMLSLLKENNVFIITHKPEKLDNIARTTIRITKKDGYSKIE